jgi:hypothetical protein
MQAATRSCDIPLTTAMTLSEAVTFNAGRTPENAPDKPVIFAFAFTKRTIDVIAS